MLSFRIRVKEEIIDDLDDSLMLEELSTAADLLSADTMADMTADLTADATTDVTADTTADVTADGMDGDDTSKLLTADQNSIPAGDVVDDRTSGPPVKTKFGSKGALYNLSIASYLNFLSFHPIEIDKWMRCLRSLQINSETT